MNKEILKKLVSAIPMTHPDELGCGDCFEQINEFAEMELLGKSAEKAMPLVREHLNRCGECREEYQSLLKALKKLKIYS
ncbi:MAG: hypothetical protein FH748_16175 [Balneolaceae bacterium]|nr:hypothetical protein [Balneolaceae bacterium]